MNEPGGATLTTWHAPDELIEAYSTGSRLRTSLVASLDQHLNRCRLCRGSVGRYSDPAALASIWERIEATVHSPRERRAAARRSVRRSLVAGTGTAGRRLAEALRQVGHRLLLPAPGTGRPLDPWQARPLPARQVWLM